MKYRIKAMDKQGKEQELIVDASSSYNSFDLVRQQGLFPVQIIETIGNDDTQEPSQATQTTMPVKQNLPIIFWFTLLGAGIWLFMAYFASGRMRVSFVDKFFRLLGQGQALNPATRAPGIEERSQVACVILFVLFSLASFAIWYFCKIGKKDKNS